MIVFAASFVGDAELLAGLDRLDAALADFRAPLEKGAEIAAESIGEGLRAGGRPEPFEPLAPSTLRATRHFRIGGPLLRTGRLEEAATDTTGNVAGSAYSVTATEARAGLDDSTPLGRIGGILSEGDDERNLPARPFVRLLEEDVDEIGDAAGDHVEEALARAFRVRAGGRE